MLVCVRATLRFVMSSRSDLAPGAAVTSVGTAEKELVSVRRGTGDLRVPRSIRGAAACGADRPADPAETGAGLCSAGLSFGAWESR